MAGRVMDTGNVPARHREVVLEVGSEGGLLTLLRERDPQGNWQFCAKRDETALSDLLSEEDRGGLGEYSSRTGHVRTFHQAVTLLDIYPWFRLHPIEVHPEFIDAVLLEVRKRGGSDEEARWRRRLKLAEESPL